MNDAEHVNRRLADFVNEPVVPHQKLTNRSVTILRYDPSALAEQTKRTASFDELTHDSRRIKLGILCDVAGNLGEVVGC